MGGAVPADWTGEAGVARTRSDNRSAEAWARAALEGLPAWLRWFVVFGWRLGLRLRLDGLHDDAHVLGWRVADRSVHAFTLETGGPLLRARLEFHVGGERVVWQTFVWYETWAARVIWRPVSLLHRVIVPYALRRAVTRSGSRR